MAKIEYYFNFQNNPIIYPTKIISFVKISEELDYMFHAEIKYTKFNYSIDDNYHYNNNEFDFKYPIKCLKEDKNPNNNNNDHYNNNLYLYLILLIIILFIIFIIKIRK